LPASCSSPWLAASLHWSGQSTVWFTAGDKTVYIDPFRLPKNAPPADLILITHLHSDHYSPKDIRSIAVVGRTLIAVPAEVLKGIAGWWSDKTTLLEPGQQVTLQGVSLETLPAYNLRKTNFHPKAAKWLGYVVTVGGLRLYHTGDSERIPEMATAKADLVLAPLDQTYTFDNVEEAAQAMLDSGASVAAPIHYGLYEGSAGDVARLEKLLADKLVSVYRLTRAE
jgi:L-ascorbate metabolism protein UlaG (beta-lactamase superfamily)